MIPKYADVIAVLIDGQRLNDDVRYAMRLYRTSLNFMHDFNFKKGQFRNRGLCCSKCLPSEVNRA